MEINSGHHDYERAASSLKGKIRYISKLYAKELVLVNFGPELHDLAGLTPGTECPECGATQ